MYYTPYPENTAEFTFLKPNGQVGLIEESHHWDPSFQQHLTATYTHPSTQLQALFRTLQERCRTVHPRVGNSAIRGSDVKCKNFMDDFLMKHPLPCPNSSCRKQGCQLTRYLFSTSLKCPTTCIAWDPKWLRWRTGLLCLKCRGSIIIMGLLQRMIRIQTHLYNTYFDLHGLQTASNNELIRTFGIIAGFWGPGFWNTPSLDCFCVKDL